ncbi:MAG TPA: hemerythrin domain-containing protein [Actinomycetota bacterium]|nr:hemerythrin domain-containing protein [Actinomycetota bacterium]
MDGPTKPDLRISYLEHRSMRADAARLTQLIGAAGPADVGRLCALADWYVRYEGAIHDHHHAEEWVVYPALLERDPSFAEADGQLEGQHQVLADRLQVTRESLTGLAGAAGGGHWEREKEEAAKAAAALKAIVDTHTGDEEAVAFPRYSAHFTADEYTGLNRAALKQIGMRSFVFAAPWVLDHATPGERARLLGEQPLLLRVIYRLALRPRYQRLVRPLGSDFHPARP